MSIAAAVLEAVQAEAERHPGSRVTKAGLRIGEISGVDTESLRFCLETLVTETDLASLTFEFELCPWQRRCRRCGDTFPVADYRVECGKCGSGDTEEAGGAQMELAWLEMEES